MYIKQKFNQINHVGVFELIRFEFLKETADADGCERIPTKIHSNKSCSFNMQISNRMFMQVGLTNVNV